jgi:hypothetical protein
MGVGAPQKMTWGCADSLDEEGQPGIGRGLPVFQPGARMPLSWSKQLPILIFVTLDNSFMVVRSIII